ncbi:unnamed protein product [Cochlearia groenlandica]
MEMILISLCLATLLAFLIRKSLLKNTTTTKKLNPPPSPWRLPVIGNLHQLSLHPHRCFRSLSHRFGPLMLLHFGRTPILVVSSAETAREVMKTNDLKFSNRPQTKMVNKLLNDGRDLAFSQYGEYWRQVKSLCVMNLFSKKTTQSFEYIREEEVNVMMDKLEKASSSSSQVNISELLTTLTNDVITRIVLGRKYSSEEGGNNSNNIVRRFNDLLGAFPLGDYIPSLSWINKIQGLDKKVDKVNSEMDIFLEKVLQGRVDIDQDKSAFVDILLSTQQDKTLQIDLDRSVLKTLLLELMFAGSATTFTLMEWTMTELLRHPECLKKLQDETRSVSPRYSYISSKDVEKMSYLNMVIKEALRLHPSGPVIPRQVNEDVKLNGYDIAAGTQVLINVWAIQRDTATWGEDAEEFKPERHLNSLLDFEGQNFKYLPFGSGRRGCPGIGLALALVEVALANLVNKFNFKVGPMGDDKPDLHEGTGLDVCRKFPLMAYPFYDGPNHSKNA